MVDVTYSPAIFEAPDLAAAREIILTSEGGATTEDRWARETPYLAALLGDALDLKPGQMVVDYGCGVGRLSKALIERYDCLVLGVDSSAAMRRLATDYVGAPAFSIISRRTFDALSRKGFKADAAVCVWVLQHCLKPAEDIALIRRALDDRAGLAVVNTLARAVPALERRWVDDGADVRAILGAQFTPALTERLDPEVVGDWVSERTFWGVYR
jgi:cyclopropane fatty-acyl-phospholipid synthase-like methyltransferase